MPRSNKYKVSDEEFVKAIKNNFSIAQTLRSLGMSIYGSSYKNFHLRVKRLNVDTSHFTGQGHLKNKTHSWNKKVPLEEVLIENSERILGTSFRKRLIEEGFLKNKCSKCGIDNTWCGEPISLQIDHINGNPFDHRLENLRILCPNCHSQTQNFGSKNKKGRTTRKFKEIKPKEKKINYCELCSLPCKNPEAKYCQACYRNNRKELQTPFERKTKIQWPPIEELLKMLEESNFWQLAKKLNVSDNAIRKHINKYRQVA